LTAERANRLLSILGETVRHRTLPADLADWLIAGFRAWQAGADLHEALGIPGPDLKRRNELLSVVVALSPGASAEARAIYVLDCLSGFREHERPDMRHVIACLQRVDCPQSIRHMQRFARSHDKNPISCRGLLAESVQDTGETPPGADCG
jgi:hypothetical protein